MAKEPAFLFYPGDYLRDTQCLSEKTQVAYDRIMCEHMRNICISQEQLNFFTKRLSAEEISELKMMLTAVDGGWQISWVAESICKRRSYSDSRRENRTKKPKTYDNDMKTYVQHMENENEIVNENKVEKGKGVKGEKPKNESAIRVMEYFNQATNRRLDTNNKSYLSNILARFKEGRTEQGLCDIVDLKVMEWTGKEHEKYLHPDTLFAAKHSQRYYDEVQAAREGRITTSQIKGTNGGKTKPTMEGILKLIYDKPDQR